MSITTEFETIIVCRSIIELRFKGGWSSWLRDFSMEDDGELSRISAMSGHDIARTEQQIQKLGLLPPKITKEDYQYRDYFIYALEYKPHTIKQLSISIPDWLICNEPLITKMSLAEIEKLPAKALKTHLARPTFDFNAQAYLT